MTEFHWFGVLIAAATILTAFGEISARKGWISLFNARKGVHVTVALCCALAIKLVPINNWFIGVVGAIVVFFYTVYRRSGFPLIILITARVGASSILASVTFCYSFSGDKNLL